MFTTIAIVFFGIVACTLSASVNQIQPGSGARIVGGGSTTITKFPYQVSLQTYGGHSCGGSLHQPTVIITAAHCLRDINVRDLEIRVGSSYHNRSGLLVKPSHFEIHSEFDTKTKFNDIGLIFLKEPLALSDSVQTIDLISSVPEDGTPGLISGWGTESFYNKNAVPDGLKFAELKVVSRDKCKSDKYSYGEDRIKVNMICATEKDTDGCQGDSGGPFAIDGKLAGVISWGFGCAESMFPGVYTNIPLFSDWIDRTIKKNAKNY